MLNPIHGKKSVFFPDVKNFMFQKVLFYSAGEKDPEPDRQYQQGGF